MCGLLVAPLQNSPVEWEQHQLGRDLTQFPHSNTRSAVSHPSFEAVESEGLDRGNLFHI